MLLKSKLMLRKPKYAIILFRICKMVPKTFDDVHQVKCLAIEAHKITLAIIIIIS